MLYTIRAWGSRVFGVWLILIAFMSSSPMSNLALPSPSMGVATAVSAVRPTTPVRRKTVAISRPSNAVLCLAQTLFFEAAQEPFEGMQAVAATVFNRMNTAGYPPSLCGVVYQPYQYSWTLIHTNWQRRPPQKYVQLAKAFLNQRQELVDEYPVTHFHRTDSMPAWSRTLEYVITIGQHKFYKS